MTDTRTGVLDPVIVVHWGLVMMTLCAVDTIDGEAVADSANLLHPTGISSNWQLSNEPWQGPEDNPLTGTTGPIPCDQEPGRKHWLVSC